MLEKEYLDRIAHKSDQELDPKDLAVRKRWKNSTMELSIQRTAIPDPADLVGYGRGKRNRQAHVSSTTEHDCHIALAAASTDTPQSYQQARLSPHWIDWEPAIAAELANMAKCDVWEPVPRENHRTIPGKWVFTRKIDGDTGKPAKFKVRYVVKGFRQVKGKDYNKVFASVAHKNSI